MRALVLTAPGAAEIQQVPQPVAGPGEAVVDVERVGVCGTDFELYSGEMSYLHSGRSWYPMRPGHEWCGTVAAVGEGVERSWLGRRVAGDTMLGCGRCHRCRAGRHHVCTELRETGISGGSAGALAEQFATTVAALRPLPENVDATAGALVEPGGNALRAVDAAEARPGRRLLILGTGTIGLLAALFARARGADVHLMGRDVQSLRPARELGFDLDRATVRAALPDLPWHSVIDASNAPELPALALHLVEPAGRVVCIGLSSTPSLLDTRQLALKDVTAVGILGGSAALAGVVAAYADGSVDPRPLVAATVGLSAAAGVLAGRRPEGAGPGPKIHIDPRR